VSPRKSVAEAAATRTRILDRALALAAVDGLEGLTIGRLAADLAMSKAGVIGHFGTKEALQLAVVAEAAERFARRVPAMAVGARPGTERLAVAFGAWIDAMAGQDAATGCFLTSVASEFDGRPGAIRDAVRAELGRWSDYVAAELRTALRAGELAADTDVDQLLFELDGVVLAARQAIQLHADTKGPDHARRALARLLDR
jgi:AcrR family transcriptional regulator